MAGLIRLWIEVCPALVPQAAVVQGSQGHHGFGVVGIPAAAAAFHPVGGGLALRFSGAAADLPGFGPELRIANHLAALGHVLHQAVGRRSLGGTAKRAPQGSHAIPGCVVSIVFERVHQLGYPVLAVLRLFAEHASPGLLGILLQVLEVQAYGVH